LIIEFPRSTITIGMHNFMQVKNAYDLCCFYVERIHNMYILKG